MYKSSLIFSYVYEYVFCVRRVKNLKIDCNGKGFSWVLRHSQEFDIIIFFILLGCWSILNAIAHVFLLSFISYSFLSAYLTFYPSLKYIFVKQSKSLQCGKFFIACTIHKIVIAHGTPIVCIAAYPLVKGYTDFFFGFVMYYNLFYWNFPSCSSH